MRTLLQGMHFKNDKLETSIWKISINISNSDGIFIVVLKL